MPDASPRPPDQPSSQPPPRPPDQPSSQPPPRSPEQPLEQPSGPPSLEFGESGDSPDSGATPVSITPRRAQAPIPPERDDYSGEFTPDFRYEDLSKPALVRLVREFAQAVHLLDRSMCAAIGMSHGGAEVQRLAIEEWRGASPVYGKRLREIMNIEGDGVSAIFKVLQLDPGFPHHYLDVRYELIDESHGFFELAYCGALMDAEPWGEKMVTSMCHHIEDGTFDYTAQAVNPKAHIKHVHRPPRVPVDQSPHCRWEITIDDDNETVPEADITKIVRGTTAATFKYPPMRDGTPHIPTKHSIESGR